MRYDGNFENVYSFVLVKPITTELNTTVYSMNCRRPSCSSLSKRETLQIFFFVFA